MIAPLGTLLQADKAITSTENQIFRELLDCHSSKGIKKHGSYMVFGKRAVADCLERCPDMARSLLVSADDLEVSFDLARLIDKKRQRENEARFSVLSFSRPLFKELDLFGTASAILLMTTPQLTEADLTVKPKGLEILCALGDPSNLGALLRSAAAFQASRVILLKECTSPFHPKAVRAASAATGITPLAIGPSIRDLPTQDTIALDMEGTAINSYRWPQNVRLLIGEEGPGIPKERDFQRVKISIANGVESLNAPVALSIALFSYRSQLQSERHI
jgi:TrmH family RNA methyltransferase